LATPISPKVTASTLAGVVASLLLAVVTLITPDLFEGLGKWSNLAYGLTIALVMAVAGYLKGDPLRETPPNPDGSYTVTSLPEAPATKFPAAAVEAALAAEPATVTPVYTPPAA